MTRKGGGEVHAEPPSPLELQQSQMARQLWEQHKQTYRPKENQLLQKIQSFADPAEMTRTVDEAVGAVGGQVQNFQPTDNQSSLAAVTDRAIRPGMATAEAAGAASLDPQRRFLKGANQAVAMGRGVQSMGQQTLSSSAASEAGEMAAQRGLSDYGKGLRAQTIGSTVGTLGGMAAYGLAKYKPWQNLGGGGSASPVAPQANVVSGNAYTPAKTYGLANAPRGHDVPWQRVY